VKVLAKAALLLLLCSLPSRADEVWVPIRARAEGLERGSRIHLELRAAFVVYEPTPKSESEKDHPPGLPDRIQTRLDSSSVLRWDFVAGGKVEEQSMTFVIPRPSGTPPAGTIGAFYFPAVIRGEFPATSAHPAWKIDRETNLGIGQGKLTNPDNKWCFKFQGFPDGFVTYGLVECRQELRHAP
jgi:hypothetical protein